MKVDCWVEKKVDLMVASRVASKAALMVDTKVVRLAVQKVD